MLQHAADLSSLQMMEAFESYKQCRDQATTGIGVFMMTDKSKKMSADTAENYIEVLQDHIKDDAIMNKDDLAKLEREMNGHTVMFSKSLKIG